MSWLKSQSHEIDYLIDAMVLVRRVLQYNPAQRPTVYEILNDPWVSGKMMIPRQVNRPKWIVSCECDL